MWRAAKERGASSISEHKSVPQTYEQLLTPCVAAISRGQRPSRVRLITGFSRDESRGSTAVAGIQSVDELLAVCMSWLTTAGRQQHAGPVAVLSSVSIFPSCPFFHPCKCLFGLPKAGLPSVNGFEVPAPWKRRCLLLAVLGYGLWTRSDLPGF